VSGLRETYEHEGPKCPCCGCQYTAGEAFYYDEGYVEEQCDRCGKTFDVRVYTSTTWTCTERHPASQEERSNVE
jgi:hypothetical protein